MQVVFRWLMGLLWLGSIAHASPGFLRGPALHGDTVVFTAEGDLWKVPVTGGEAMRLTSHPGMEGSAALSPDGMQVAFSAQYEGPVEVYVMPIGGGLPKRLTWHGEGAAPVGWTPDGKVLCATRAHSTLPNMQLVAIDPLTGSEALVPLAQASEGGYDPDGGKRLIFTRLSMQGSSTKRYQGGTAQNLWRFDEGADSAIPLTADFRGTSKNPMWWQGRVVFLSDRSGVMNLWSMTPEGGDLKPLTDHKDFEVRDADLHGGRIVYQRAGGLRLLNLADGTDVEIAVTRPSDLDQTRDRWVTKPMDYLTRFSLSPDGGKLVLTARGSIFVAPVKPGGRFIEIPRAQDVRYREAAFLEDGKSLIAQSDETGEIEMVKIPVNGVGEVELLTQDGGIFRYAPLASPDGRRLAWQDKNLDLWVRDLETLQSVKVSTSPIRGFPDLRWSPDSQWLAFVEPAPNTFTRLRLYHVVDGTILDATGDRVMSGSPAWSADGKWLYFLSDRELQSLVKSPWGPRQPEPFFTESTRIYAISLRQDERFPFTPPDELTVVPAAEEKTHEEKAKHATAVVTIDAAGLAERLFEVPGVSGNLSGLVATAGHLFFVSRAPGATRKPQLMRLEIGDDRPTAKVFVEDPKGWEISADGKSMVVRKGDAFYVVPTAGDAPAKLEKAVSLAAWRFAIDPKEEWRQIYRESWRMLRDFFYDPKMHGVDWLAIRQKYEPLVERVADRSDLSEILHEMSGELSALHISVRFGDLREGPDDIAPSSLGARLSRDEVSGGWRVDHIFRHDPDYPNTASPLARPGAGVKVGEVILAINGREVRAAEHPQQLLAEKAGQQVLLEVQAVEGGARRNVLVRPLSREAAANLRYTEWEITRRLETERIGEGKIGYVHLRDMGPGSIVDWAREFYPVFDRQGLIIDVRHNRGGNTDAWILSRLLRKAWFHWAPRAGQPYANMHYAFRGHVAVLCNEWTASDGEAFAEGFRRLGMGKVFGTRTWGGQIWLNAQRWLVDNGMCSAAEIGVYGPEGEWLIEGVGLIPDVTVDNEPHAAFHGKDAQLEAALNHLRAEIARDPRPVPQPPARPDKSE